MLERQMLLAENAYHSMVLAADGYRMYVLAVQDELRLIDKELQREKDLVSRNSSVECDLKAGEASCYSISVN